MWQSTSGNQAPTNLNMNNFKAALDALGHVAKGCRFAVRISPVNGSTKNRLSSLSYASEIPNLIYVCDAVEFPGRGFDVSDIRYYGPSQSFPNNTMYGGQGGGSASLSFICGTRGIERQLFDDWQDIINPTTTFNFRFPEEYYGQIDIFQFADYGKSTGSVKFKPEKVLEPEVIYSWRLNKAWPTLVAPQQVTWADQDILRLNVTFAYKWWERPGDTEQASTKK